MKKARHSTLQVSPQLKDYLLSYLQHIFYDENIVLSSVSVSYFTFSFMNLTLSPFLTATRKTMNESAPRYKPYRCWFTSKLYPTYFQTSTKQLFRQKEIPSRKTFWIIVARLSKFIRKNSSFISQFVCHVFILFFSVSSILHPQKFKSKWFFFI